MGKNARFSKCTRQSHECRGCHKGRVDCQQSLFCLRIRGEESNILKVQAAKPRVAWVPQRQSRLRTVSLLPENPWRRMQDSQSAAAKPQVVWMPDRQLYRSRITRALKILCSSPQILKQKGDCLQSKNRAKYLHPTCVCWKRQQDIKWAKIFHKPLSSFSKV